MNNIALVDLRLPDPVCWRYTDRSMTIGFSPNSDFKLPEELKWPDMDENVATKEPLFSIHRRRMSLPQQGVLLWILTGLSTHGKLKFRAVPREKHGNDADRDDGFAPNRFEVKPGGCVSIVVNRGYPDGLWPLGQLVFGSQDENATSTTDECPFLSIPPEVKDRIMEHLDFEAVATVLPTLSKESFASAVKSLQEPIWPDLKLRRGVDGLGTFLALAAARGIGKNLRSLELLDDPVVGTDEVNFTAADPQVMFIKDVADFFELVPKLENLTIGSGFLVFGGSHRNFTSNLKSLSFCWETVAHWRNPFPFSAFPHLKSLVINNVQRPWHDVPPHMEPRQLEEISKLKELEVLSIAGCVFPGESRFVEILKNLPRSLKVLRLPRCFWVRDEVAQVIADRFTNLEILEVSSPHLTDEGLLSMIKSSRQLKALIAKDMYSVTGNGWLDQEGRSSLPETLELVDVEGSAAAIHIPSLGDLSRKKEALAGDWEHLGEPFGFFT